MLFKSAFTVTAMIGSAFAGFDIQTGATQWWYTDDAQSKSIVDAMSKAYESYASVVETQAVYKSALGAFYTYARTRDGIPEVATATGTTAQTTFTTLPDWYTAMPADALKVFESIRNEDDKIWSSVVPKAARTSGSQGAAAQITAMPLYIHGAVAAMIGAVAGAL